MGTLDDSDIEKISNMLKNRNMPKIFHNPSTAFNIAYWLGFALAISLTITVLIILFTGAMFDTSKEKINQYEDLLDNFLDHSNCDSLLSVYSSLDSDAESAKQKIKNEIVLRCD